MEVPVISRRGWAPGPLGRAFAGARAKAVSKGTGRIGSREGSPCGYRTWTRQRRPGRLRFTDEQTHKIQVEETGRNHSLQSPPCHPGNPTPEVHGSRLPRCAADGRRGTMFPRLPHL